MIEELKRRLHTTGIGLGLAALGRPGYMTLTHDSDLPDKSKEAMKSHAHDMLNLAWENGVRYFDVARSYGDGEKFLASWLNSRHIKKEEVVIGSKWGYVYVADWQVDVATHEIKYHTLENLEKQWQESREILGDYLNIYHIHSATLKSGVLDDRSILDRLYEISQSGVTIGLSLTGTGQAEVLQKSMGIKYEGNRLFQSVQATWNMLERSAEEQLRQAAGNGCFVILKEVMANGRIADNSTASLSEKQLQIIHELKNAYQMTADQLAMRFALQQDFADVVLSGAANENHLLSNLKADSITEDIDIWEGLSENATSYWQTRSSLAWI
ncbi:MAG: aldo/keto reductase [Cyclobacteriaceae bacterium]